MNKPNHREKYCVSLENNQLVLTLNSDILLPEDAPVRVTSAQLKELDYRKLYEVYSSRGRKSVNDPRVLFNVMAYGYSRCSTNETRQDINRQVRELKQAGAEQIFVEYGSSNADCSGKTKSALNEQQNKRNLLIPSRNQEFWSC